MCSSLILAPVVLIASLARLTVCAVSVLTSYALLHLHHAPVSVHLFHCAASLLHVRFTLRFVEFVCSTQVNCLRAFRARAQVAYNASNAALPPATQATGANKAPIAQTPSHPASPGRVVRGVQTHTTTYPHTAPKTSTVESETAAVGCSASEHPTAPITARAHHNGEAAGVDAQRRPSKLLFSTLSSVLADKVKDNVLNTPDALEERYRALLIQKQDAERLMSTATGGGTSLHLEASLGAGAGSSAAGVPPPIRSRESGPDGRDYVLYTDPKTGPALSETLPWLFCRRCVP